MRQRYGLLMPPSRKKLDWCAVRLGEDLNWWVREVSHPQQWDQDAQGIIDPRQMDYVLEQCEPLREYGFDSDIIEEAFIPFGIEREEAEGAVRLTRSREALLEEDTVLYALPDQLDEEKGPYADFLEQITRYRVVMLNDLIDFEQKYTVEELEEDLRDRHNQEYLEGKALHPFLEVSSILDFVPEGFELEDDEDKGSDEGIEDIPDFEEDDERIEEDETMRWDEDDDSGDNDSESDEASGKSDGDEDDDAREER